MKSIELLKFSFLVLVMCLFFAGCDDDDDERSDDLFALSNAVPSTVVVSLSGNLGTIVSFTNLSTLPDVSDDIMAALLEGNIISVTVTNESGISAYLFDGDLVDGTPASAGQYQVILDGENLAIVFFNQTTKGQVLTADGNYTASIMVSVNDFFAGEAFTRKIVIQ